MTNSKGDVPRSQMLVVQLDALRKDLHKLIDVAISNIARTCVGVSPDVFEYVVASAFKSIMQSVDKNMATAAPAMVTDGLSPKTDAQLAHEPKKRVCSDRRVAWANSSNATLRTAHNKRIRAGKPIEPDLEAELIKRFPTYDAITHLFTGHQPGMAKPRKTDWTKSPAISLRQCYVNRIRAGKPIEPDLEAELIKRFPTYDAITHRFTDFQPGVPKLRKTDWTKSTNHSLRAVHNKRIHACKPIEPDLEAELVKRFPTYSAITHNFAGHGGKDVSGGAVRSRGAKNLADMKQMPEKAKTEYMPKPTIAPIATPMSVVDSPVAPKPDLVVTVRTLDGSFYDVFVNGKRILKNHIDTEIKLFLDGTVLGVHGRVTDIKNFPDTPSWQIYDTNLKRRDFSHVSMLPNESVFIKDIKKLNDTQIILDISNKVRIILDKKNVQQVFKIASEKTK